MIVVSHPTDRRTADLVSAADAVMGVQRDFGNRAERARARFKYTVADKGVEWIKGEIERRMGAPLAPARPYAFDTNADSFGWHEGADGRWSYTLFIENGRIVNLAGWPMLDGLRALAEAHRGSFRVTPNQNLTIADVDAADRAGIDAILAEYGLLNASTSALRLHSIACVAMPTCPLAMAEAERYQPELITKIEGLLTTHGLTDEPITIRMSGCPNGCSRPYVAEIALTGRAPGKYNLYLGAGFHGERLGHLHAENIGEAAILGILDETLGRFARERTAGEHFGDWTRRASVVPA